MTSTNEAQSYPPTQHAIAQAAFDAFHTEYAAGNEPDLDAEQLWQAVCDADGPDAFWAAFQTYRSYVDGTPPETHTEDDHVHVVVSVNIPHDMIAAAKMIYAEPDMTPEGLATSWLENGLDNLYDWMREEGMPNPEAVWAKWELFNADPTLAPTDKRKAVQDADMAAYAAAVAANAALAEEADAHETALLAQQEAQGDSDDELVECAKHGPQRVVEHGRSPGYTGAGIAWWTLACGCSDYDDSGDNAEAAR